MHPTRISLLFRPKFIVKDTSMAILPYHDMLPWDFGGQGQIVTEILFSRVPLCFVNKQKRKRACQDSNLESSDP